MFSQRDVKYYFIIFKDGKQPTEQGQATRRRFLHRIRVFP